ncbi:FxLYD domain-containing protein [Streptomyces sp. NPDC059524]|uniref:FxLYD domain-containing protein n=1 Tax=Streptomyces sp. NPDC059524 TaxID=3346856 RepID=UPI0036D12761
MRSDLPRGRSRRPLRGPVALAVCTVLAGAAGLTACGDDGGDESGPSASPRPTAPERSNFSGEPPSPLASKASEAESAASEAAASAEASASRRAHDFEASVSADVERNRQEYRKALDSADGQGNAMKDVSLTGKPLAQTDNVRALVVHITNSTDQKASYAVQVDFSDADGKVVESTVVGARDLDPGERAQPLAISTKPPEPHLTAKIAKAQRY